MSKSETKATKAKAKLSLEPCYDFAIESGDPVTVITSDGTPFKASRRALCVHSEYFMKMLDGADEKTGKQVDHNVVEVDGHWLVVKLILAAIAGKAPKVIPPARVPLGGVLRFCAKYRMHFVATSLVPALVTLPGADTQSAFRALSNFIESDTLANSPAHLR